MSVCLKGSDSNFDSRVTKDLSTLDDTNLVINPVTNMSLRLTKICKISER